ncbi:hypothetical protein F5883DRAFT_653117 [Diaporthe sp. PMI_573]|nr:hypothetical protein F5883DRAFT_653117 [Diaporthaceae sp. PMI_573]
MSCVRAVARALFRKDLANNHDMHHAIIIAGFCAIGKTHFRSNRNELEQGMEVHDLDSSAYSSKPDFPQNYISAIRKLAEKPCIILVSTHRGLPTQLAREGYYVAVVYPCGGSETKREWLRRLEEREEGGKDSRLYKLTDEKWASWYEATACENVTNRWTLCKDQYLGTVFEEINADFRRWQCRQGGR